MPISCRRAGAPLIRIEVRFTAGQYSARAWGAPAGHGRHEWPPSPFRIVRAAAAAWKYNLPDIAEERFYAAVRRLASELPLFCLPRARHAVRPGGSPSGAPLPPWQIDPGHTLHVIWPEAALAGDERATLSDVLGRVPYLGRTDSWCEMRLGGGEGGGGPAAAAAAAGTGAPPCRVNCRPYEHGGKNRQDGVPARVIVPRPDITMEDVYRKDSPSDRERATACPDGAAAVPYLIDRDAAGPCPVQGE